MIEDEEPWEVLGLTEAEYFKLRFLEAHLKTEKLLEALKLCKGFGRFDKDEPEEEIAYVRKLAREAIEEHEKGYELDKHGLDRYVPKRGE